MMKSLAYDGITVSRWFFAGATILAIAVTLASVRWAVVWRPVGRSWWVGVWAGQLWMGSQRVAGQPGWTLQTHTYFFRWGWGFVASRWILILPLWIFVLLLLIATTISWSAHRRSVTKSEACAVCGYEVGCMPICPECGTSQLASASREAICKSHSRRRAGRE